MATMRTLTKPSTALCGAAGGAIPDEAGDDLARLAAEHDPNPAWVGFGAHKTPKLVQLQHVARLGAKKRFTQGWQSRGFFLSHLATACRATPKTRSAARKLRRSTATIRRTIAWRSGAMAGLLAARTRRAPQALQKYCWVPEPLWPALTRDGLAHVAQQGAEVLAPSIADRTPFVTRLCQSQRFA